MKAVIAAWPTVRRAVPLISLHASQELVLSIGVTPGVGLEPPSPDSLDQRGEVAMLAGLLVRRIQVGVVTPH
jgi:hypothetical protein